MSAKGWSASGGNVLIITAHPSSKGFTHRIAESYKKGSEESNNNVEVLDLCDDKNKQEYLEFESIKDLAKNKQRDRMQDKIKWADELVFIFPVWWATCPAVMKNYFDTNFLSGFAYQKAKIGFDKKLKGRTARIFMTCDGIKYMYNLPIAPTKIIWKYFMLGFCGIKLKSFIVFDRMFKRDEARRNKWLKKVYEMGKK